MNPILAYRLTVQPPRMSDQKEPSTVFVTLQVPNSTAVNYIQFSSEDARALDEVQAWLSTEYGPFGHSIGDRACAADLAFVMDSPNARIYQPVCLSGGELIPDKFDSVPDDALS